MWVLKKLLFILVRMDLTWFFLRPFSRLGSFLMWARNEIEHQEKLQLEEVVDERLFGNLFHERKVLNGPFKGLQYPSYKAVGSALYSKLMGSYEKELHGIIESLCEKKFSEIINVGCGEGYYAIGFSRRIKEARIYAFDTDQHAMMLCQQMADLNHAADRIVIGDRLTSSDLKNFSFTKSGLIFCDCEGFEKELFTSSILENLKHCYLVIESHDFKDITISGSLADLFSPTHHVSIIKSVDDIEKAKTYDFPQTKDFDLMTRKKLFAEGRPAVMEWLYLVPKESGN